MSDDLPHPSVYRRLAQEARIQVTAHIADLSGKVGNEFYDVLERIDANRAIADKYEFLALVSKWRDNDDTV